MRKFQSILIALALCVLAPFASARDVYPSKPIILIVPVAAGGWQDTNSRLIAQRMSTTLGQPIVVENRPSDGSITGTQYVGRAAPDGYTLLAISDTFAIAPFMRKVAYDPRKDFVGVGQMVRAPMMIVVGAESKIHTVADIIHEAKGRPGALSFASGGYGSTTHLVAEEFAGDAQIRMLHVPYKGNEPALADVIAGRVGFIFSPISSAMQLMKAGMLRPIAVTTLKRSSLFPSVPTLAESGFPNFDSSVFSALLAPAGTPAPVIDRLRSALEAAKKDPGLVAAVQARGDEIAPTQTLPEFSAFLQQKVSSYQRLIQEKGITSQ